MKRAALLWVLMLAACTIQLVPSYDQALVEGLDGANTEALTLFAAVENGSPAGKFAAHEETYSEVIGTFDALRQRAANRQIPPLAARLSKIRLVRDYCNSDSDPAGCVNVSPASLDRVLAVLRKMRDRHQSRGLEPDTVALFRTDYNTAIAQALTVENALKR
ncbi:MAG: hypothetical protein ACJ8EI_09565 [Sphingomicrobium sp.]